MIDYSQELGQTRLQLIQALNSRLDDRDKVLRILDDEDNMKITDLRDLCLLCRSYLKSQSSGSRLEKVLKRRFGLLDKDNNESGDATSCIGNIEIKISLGNDTDEGYCLGQQIRPHYAVDFYLCMYYNRLDDEVSLHLVPAKIMVCLAEKYGGRSHGTKKTNDDNTTVELSLFGNKFNKPKGNKPPSKAYRAWLEINEYRKTELELFQIFGQHD